MLEETSSPGQNARCPTSFDGGELARVFKEEVPGSPELKAFLEVAMMGLSGAVGKGQAPAEVLVSSWVLLGMAVVFFALGAYSLGRRQA